MISDAVNPHHTVTFAGWSGTDWVLSGFSVYILSDENWLVSPQYFLQPFFVHFHASEKFSSKSLSCWQVRRKQVLYMAKFVKIAIEDVSQNCMHRALKPAQYSGNSPSSERFHTTAWFLLHCCGHLYNYRRMNSSPPFTKLLAKRTFLFKFLDHF